MLIVRVRQTRLRLTQQQADTTTPESYHGLTPNFGLFYGLGMALIGEGFFSATYHACPNATNFQFDTTFMYVVVPLLLQALGVMKDSSSLGSVMKESSSLGMHLNC
jgi:hypothetical protein